MAVFTAETHISGGNLRGCLVNCPPITEIMATCARNQLAEVLLPAPTAFTCKRCNRRDGAQPAVS